MASTLPPAKGVAFAFPITLVSQADTDVFKETVTLAAGDIQVSKDGAQFDNLATFPPSELNLAASAASGTLWVQLTATEMTADVVTVLFRDAAGAEWQSALVTIYTAGQTLDTTDGVADAIKIKTDYLPSATAGANGGLPTVNASNYIAGIAGTKNTLDSLSGADGDTLKTLSDQLDGISSTAGAGSETVIIECLNAASAPLEGVAVWITSDSAGASLTAGTLYSNSLGRATFYLDAGTYYCWRQGGALWSNPETIVVVDV